MRANPFKMLQDDHRRVARLFSELESQRGKSTKSREHLFDQLKHELHLHTEIEEQYMYPLLEENDETRDMVLESYEEHDLVKTILSEMDKEELGSEAWEAKLTVMKENVEHHVSEEEEELFPEAEDILSDEAINQLAHHISEAKAAAAPARKAQ